MKIYMKHKSGTIATCHEDGKISFAGKLYQAKNQASAIAYLKQNGFVRTSAIQPKRPQPQQPQKTHTAKHTKPPRPFWM